MKPAPQLTLTETPPEPIAWMLRNPAETESLLLCCFGISVVLILHLWLSYRRASLLKKIAWSLILLLPLLGWLLYFALFNPPGYSDTPLNDTSGAENM